MSLFTGIRRVGTSDNLYGLWYFMLKMWHAALFGTASTRSQVGTVGYALGKQRGMFSILLTRVGEACQGVEQFYLGNVRYFFFFFCMACQQLLLPSIKNTDVLHWSDLLIADLLRLA